MSCRHYVYLSYPIEENVPTYGRPKTPILLEKRKCQTSGDSCNSYWFGMENHWGTHIDAPAHFFNDGASISDYEPSFWFFCRPQIIQVKVSKDLLIRVEDLLGKVREDTDILILKTDFGKLRGSEEYSCANPGVHSEVGKWLRAKFPLIRVIAMDFISLSSFQNREEGRASHRSFLSPYEVGRPILILEDVNLQKVENTLDEVIIMPLILKNVDSSPCTVIGIMSEH